MKFELLDASPVIMMTESGRLYTHVNFTARSSKEGSKEQLFFAELYNCGKRRAPGGFIVTCCEPLGSDSTGEPFPFFFCIHKVQHSLFINYSLL
jgi:hypothetical protein